MARIGIFLIFFIGLVSAGLIALSGWQIPAPTVVVNKVIPNENLPK
jgi:ABC-type transport system involved in cytochrome bd biosynthesis fused ATPase/permease subunit